MAFSVVNIYCQYPGAEEITWSVLVTAGFPKGAEFRQRVSFESGLT